MCSNLHIIYRKPLNTAVSKILAMFRIAKAALAGISGSHHI